MVFIVVFDQGVVMLQFLFFISQDVVIYIFRVMNIVNIIFVEFNCFLKCIKRLYDVLVQEEEKVFFCLK